MTQSGKLNKKIILGNKKWKKDNEGFQYWEIEEFAKPWASVKPVTEQVDINGQDESVMKERVTFEIYYREGITKKMIIMFKDKVYQITGIFNPGFNNEMLILTGEREDSRGDKVEQ